MMLRQQWHMSGTLVLRSHIQRYQLNCTLRKNSPWTYIVLEWKLSQSLVPILLSQGELSLTSLLINNA